MTKNLYFTEQNSGCSEKWVRFKKEFEMKTMVVILAMAMVVVAWYGESTPVHQRHSQANSSNCFIKTAAWRSPLADKVIYMQHYRDELVQQSEYGRRVVNLYYGVSPAIANGIRNNDILRAMVRALLQPLAYTTKYRITRENQRDVPTHLSLNYSR